MKATAGPPVESKGSPPPDSYTFGYTVSVELWLTRADIDLLIFCAKHHYDGVCQEFGLRAGEQSLKGNWKASKNGRLTIIRDFDLAVRSERAPVLLTQREIDTMLKILEMASFLKGSPIGAHIESDHIANLSRRLREAFAGITAEYYRLKKATPVHAFST